VRLFALPIEAEAGAKSVLMGAYRSGKALCCRDLRANSRLTRMLEGQAGADKSSNQ